MSLPMKPWTPEELEFLRENSTKMNRAQLAKQLGRSRSGVGNIIKRLGLPVRRDYIEWTPELRETLERLSEVYGHKEISQKMGIPLYRVSGMIKRLGIRTRTDVFSLNKACSYTGYHPLQLKRAQRALKQVWRLTKHRGKVEKSRPMLRFRITYEQLEAMCEYLKYEGHHDARHHDVQCALLSPP